MIDFFETKSLWTGHIFTIDQYPSKDSAGTGTHLKENGVVGIASELILCGPEFNVLADYLLGRVVVADHMDNALKLARKYRYSLRIVTLEGESLSPGGSISGGTFKNASNLLGRHREMEEMETRMERLKTELALFNRQTDEAHDAKRGK